MSATGSPQPERSHQAGAAPPPTGAGATPARRGAESVPAQLALTVSLVTAAAFGTGWVVDLVKLEHSIGVVAAALIQALLIGIATIPLAWWSLVVRIRRVERRAAEQHARSREAINNAAPVMIWSSGPNGDRTHFNSRWLAFRGRPLEREIGQGWEAGVHPEDRERCAQERRAAHEARRQFSLEYRLRCANDDYRWVLDQGAPRFGAAGDFLGYVGAVLDVTEQKETEACLQEALAELRDVTTALNESCIVSTTDNKGRINYVNQQFEKISGYTRAEVMGKDHRLVNSGHHARTLWKDMYRTVLAGGAWKCVIRNRVKNGGYYWVASTMKGIFGADGALKKIISIRTDVTGIKALAEELQQARDAAQAADRSKSEFLANMSHEIRTPMAAILGFTELLQDEDDLSQAPPARAKLLSDIRRNGEHLLSVINDILDLSKIEAGRLEAHWTDCSPMGVVEDAAAMLRQRAEVKGLSLNIEVVGELPAMIHTDPLRTRQILLNLIGNAIKFTEHGSVTVRVSATPGPDANIVCEVIDTGIGISEEQGRLLFQPFAQVDTSHTRRFGGTGLGLTISRRLAGILNGTLDFSSRVGEGTTFVLTLPVGHAQETSSPVPSSTPATLHQVPPQASAPKTLPLAGRRILLAEDGPDNWRIVIHFLSKAGATIEAVEDGQSAQNRALEAQRQGEPFDIVLMDVQMPVLDGLGATRGLRSAGYSGAIIALTAHAMPSDRNECLDAGCDEYLTKPIDRKVLISTCAKWADHGKSARAA